MYAYNKYDRETNIHFRLDNATDIHLLVRQHALTEYVPYSHNR